MEAMRKSWTDERLDHFSERVDRRFDEVDRRFDEVDRRFTEADKRFDKFEVEFQRINDRLDVVGKSIIYGALTLSGSMVAGFVAMTALIVTQL
jgi:RNase H-fold protein (predicted Holliday junction resolvase)